MKVTVLGGSAAGANTGAGCSGYLIETAGARFVIDAGPGTFPELRKHIDFRTLDAILITHLHLDHTLDLGAYRFALAYNPQPPAGSIPLWMPPGGRAFLDAFAAPFADLGEEPQFFTRVFSVAEYDPSGEISVGDATIRFLKTVHYRPCWAMRVSAPGSGDFVFTADAGPATPFFPFIEGCQAMAAESGTLDDEGETFAERGHLTPEEAGALAKRAGAETLLLTHLWEEHGLDVYRDRAEAAFGGPVVVARPGVSIEA